MARLEYQIRELSAAGFDPATLVEFSGSVDPDTLEVFEGVMDKLADAGKRRIVFDFNKVKYINSTGMGMMVQFNDTLSEEGGGLVLMRIQPKVLLVVEMLGLQALFKIVSTEAEALQALAGAQVGPATIEVKLAEESRPAAAPPPVTVEMPAAIEETVFCPACRAELSLPQAGVYRCPRCRSALQVEAGGAVQAYPEAVRQICEISLPPEEDYVMSIHPLLFLAAQRGGLQPPAAEALAAVATGCLNVLAKHALNGDAPHERIHLFVRPGQGKVAIRIYCGGKPLPTADAIYAFRQDVDRLDYAASAQGNLVSIEKSG